MGDYISCRSRRIQVPDMLPPPDRAPKVRYGEIIHITPEEAARLLASPILSEPAKRLVASMAIYGTAAVLVQEDAPDGD